ncbi:hypothetical protein Dimus_036730 [Dionaea muscipula]
MTMLRHSGSSWLLLERPFRLGGGGGGGVLPVWFASLVTLGIVVAVLSICSHSFWREEVDGCFCSGLTLSLSLGGGLKTVIWTCCAPVVLVYLWRPWFHSVVFAEGECAEHSGRGLS